MSVPGIDLESQEPPEPREIAATDPTPPVTEPEDDDELVQTIEHQGVKLVPIGEMLRFRKESKQLKKQLADLQPQVERMAQVEQQIAEIRPYAEFIKQNPEILEHAANGTKPSRTAEQPVEDIEARDTAEDLGLYTADNKLDIARARRILDRATSNAEKKLQKEIEPLRRQTVEGQAAAMKQRLYSLKAQDGVTPIATRESLDEMSKVLPADLLAQPNVAFFVALAAAGFDKFNGRAPKAAQRAEEPEYDEPLHTEAPGRRGSGLNPELQKLGQRMGVTEAQLKDINQKYVPGKALALE